MGVENISVQKAALVAKKALRANGVKARLAVHKEDNSAVLYGRGFVFLVNADFVGVDIDVILDDAGSAVVEAWRNIALAAIEKAAAN